MGRVEELCSIASLAGLRAEWDRVLGETHRPSFFQSLDWLECYWRHYGNGQSLRVLVVREDGRLTGDDRPMGIVPLVVRREQTRAGEVRILTYPLDDWGAFFAPLGSQPEMVLTAALRHVRNSRRDWDLLDLRWVNPRLDRDATPRAMASAGLTAYPQLFTEAGLIDLHGTWDDYWASRTSHWRNNVRRAERRLADAGKVTHIHYRPRGAAQVDGDPRWDLYDECEAIAAASWQGSSTTGTTLSHAPVRAFLRDMHTVAAACGSVDLHLLRVGGRPAAFAYNYAHRGYVFGLRTGYDAQVSRDGLGTLMLRHVIESGFRQGDHTLDLGIDYLDCKGNWLTSVVPVYRYTHFAPGAPKAQLLRLKRIAEKWFPRTLATPASKTAVAARSAAK